MTVAQRNNLPRRWRGCFCLGVSPSILASLECLINSKLYYKFTRKHGGTKW